jgi:coiled-coil domain-containing protein 130
MSSLAATQADGYYAPPEYYESGAYKKQSVSQFNENSKGNNQYLKQGVVRFELPYDGFCQGCGEHVGKGTRFNAKKSKVGSYFTSPIYKFIMTCRVCSKNEFVIQTNPKEKCFDYVEGIHKQVQEFDTSEAGTAGVIDTEYGNKLVPTMTSTSQAHDDTLSRMESVASGARKTMTEREQLESLMNVNNRTFSNDAGSNAAIRSTFRADRKKRKRRLQDGQALGWNEGMELAEETVDDVASARSTCFGKGMVTEKEKFRNLRASSIFGNLGAGKRKPKTKRRAIGDGPDDVRSSSLSSSSVKQNAVLLTPASSGTVVKQEADMDIEKKRIRLVACGAKLERQAEIAAATKATKDSSLALLLDGYGSDSD